MGGGVRIEYRLAEHTTLGFSALFSRCVGDFDGPATVSRARRSSFRFSDPDANFTVVNNVAYRRRGSV
jgi:hypothetical protein